VVSDTEAKRLDLKALEALQEDERELERIENLLDRFNVFELVGFVNDEMTHSDFLAFLLDPNRNDGLGDILIKEVLRETLPLAHKALPPSMFGSLDRMLEDVDGMDFGQTLVCREHHDIDILLMNEDHKLAVIIENKIWAGEGPGQLDWYKRIIRHTYPDYDVLKVYITRYGNASTHEEYVPFSHGAVCHIMDRILEDEA
jgi:PD-(D/E)XK nuclease superfamily